MLNKRRMLRIAAALLVLVAVILSFNADLAMGTLCVFCPVGFLEIAASSKAVPWELLPYVLALLLVVFALGKAFCSWLCPTSLLKNIFGGRSPRGILGRTGESCSVSAGGCRSLLASDSELATSESAPCTCGSTSLKSQGIVLAVLLAVSLLVGFPVFCLLCPIGLMFGTLWAVNRVFILLQPGWELIIFPLMLFAELFLFKKWCSAICPLGFFFNLVAKLRTKTRFGVKPQVNCASCISNEGCQTCSTVCPESIDVASAGLPELESCTTCLDCVEHCPTKSIRIGVGKGEEPTDRIC